MADSRTGASSQLDTELGARSHISESHSQNSPSSPNIPSSYSKSTSKRGVRSTRTPAGSRDGEPQRSQTVPVPTTNAGAQPRRGVRPPTSTPTMPLPETRQRKPSSHANQPYNTLGPDSDYIVEPLPSPSAQQEHHEHDDNPYLALPPPMPVPIIDLRHSMSSFQTEPSSYYSMEDNWSSVGGPPVSMPKPSVYTAESAGPDTPSGVQRTPSTPSMPVPDLPPPSIPIPSLSISAPQGQQKAREGNPFGTIRIPEPPPQLYPPPSPRRRRLSGTPPIPPTPTSPPPPPPIPTPELSRPGITFSHHQPTARPSGSNHAGSGQGPPKPIKLPPTAPLRVQHHPPRPTSTSSTDGAGGTVTIFPPSGSGRVSSSHAQQSATRIDSQPGGNAPTKVGATPNTPTTGSSAHRPESRPTPPTTTPVSPPHKTSAVSHVPPKPTSIYSQANRLDSSQSPATSGTGKTTQNAHISTATPSNVPQRPSTVNSQPTTTQRPPTVHSQASGAQRPSTVHTQASTAQRPSTDYTQDSFSGGRPHEIPIPSSSRPGTSAPQPHTPTPGGAKEKEKEQHKDDHAAEAATASIPNRPHFRSDPSQMDTQYVNMLLALDDIPLMHNLLAAFFNWILLAGFILFPGTFTSLQNLSASNGGQVPAELIGAVTNIPLYVIAWVCCAVGAAGMIWLWWRWRKNYLWALNKVFFPGLLNCLAGLLSTIVNLFGVQHGELSTTSKSTLIVTTLSSGVFLILAGFYSLWLVRRVKARHDREVGKERTGKHGEGVVDLSKRRARQ